MTPVDNFRSYLDDNNYGRKIEEQWKEHLGEYIKKFELGYELVCPQGIFHFLMKQF